MNHNDAMTPDEEVQFVRTLAEQGNSRAQHNLGAMYLNGSGVQKDHEQALHWFEKAAQQGDALSQHNLGAIYLQGLGGAPDPAAAAHWFTKAAMQGDPRSQYSLGALYFEGLGLERNLEKAYIWLSLALQGAPDERKSEMRQVRDYVASQLSPPQIESARNATIEILHKMDVS